MLAALVPAVSLAQQNPGLSVRPAGQTLQGPPQQEQLIDLSRPNPEPMPLGMTPEEQTIFDAAMRGEAWAQTKLGKIYIASGDEARRQQGMDLLRRAAEQNDAEANYVLATLTATGAGIDQSDIGAFGRMKRAAELGFAEAQYELASMFSEGRGTPQDEDAAISWGRKAARAGNTEAKYALAIALLRQKASPAEALQWLQSAADDGHREALFFLAGATAHGDYGLVKDERKAAEMALPRAEKGDAEFQFALATLYLRGETFADQREEGQRWLEKAAASGQPVAQQMLEQQEGPAPRGSEPAEDPLNL